MAMNKKEREALEAAERQARVNRALRWSDYSVERDVPPPTSGHGTTLSRGWDAMLILGGFRSITTGVGKKCSSSISHGIGWEKTSTQNPISLYSTRLKALCAQRVLAERAFAEMLADIDEAIAAEIAGESKED